jgi:hypothetical protein
MGHTEITEIFYYSCQFCGLYSAIRNPHSAIPLTSPLQQWHAPSPGSASPGRPPFPVPPHS